MRGNFFLGECRFSYPARATLWCLCSRVPSLAIVGIPIKPASAMPKKASGRRFVEREKAGRECGVAPNPAVLDCVGSGSSRTLLRADQS